MYENIDVPVYAVPFGSKDCGIGLAVLQLKAVIVPSFRVGLICPPNNCACVFITKNKLIIIKKAFKFLFLNIVVSNFRLKWWGLLA